MGLENNLSINLSQKLFLSQNMKLSLKILQMNSKELDKFLQKEQESNIFIKIEKKNFEQGRSYKDSEYDPYKEIAGKQTSFYDHLYLQIGERILSQEMQEICGYIIDNIDSRGYLSHQIKHPYNQLLFEKSLKIVRSFDPRGVAGNDLRSCLLLQLDADEIYERKTIKNYLEDLAYGDKSKIAKNLGIDMNKMIKVIKRIKSLNPIPSNGYYIDERKEKLIPDAYIKIYKNKIDIKLNEEIIPRILIEQSEVFTENNKYQKYILRCKKRAEFIINCINQRQKTLKRVIEEVVLRQKDFFFNDKLKPLTLLEVADSLEIHQSTVSRAIKNRYIYVGGKIITLKSLFAKQFKPRNDNGTTDEMTREQIKNIIYKIIMREDKTKPYSDEILAKILLKDKIKISRRTIAKYRKELSLLSSSKRRRRSKDIILEE